MCFPPCHGTKKLGLQPYNALTKQRNLTLDGRRIHRQQSGLMALDDKIYGIQPQNLDRKRRYTFEIYRT